MSSFLLELVSCSICLLGFLKSNCSFISELRNPALLATVLCMILLVLRRLFADSGFGEGHVSSGVKEFLFKSLNPECF